VTGAGGGVSGAGVAARVRLGAVGYALAAFEVHEQLAKRGVDSARVVVADARGPGHGLASPEGTAAAEQAMRTEGLMVDPVYTAKGLALVSRYAGNGNVVFWHTGGQLDAVALAAEAGR
jgi:1-aminocyclopropane-1-carboxylate deaminase/D-cysteine desulfhydrase-like pyridoxal-dependent ACC family enzyme